MDLELLTIFDENRIPIGVATRGDIHKYGHWHEAFHCWFINKKDNHTTIYFQLRSENKKDYPNLLDITAAGHLLSHETIEDGIREVKEEIGIDVNFDELFSLGVVEYVVHNDKIIDKEFAHVFLYHYEGDLEEFVLQKEEVSGVFYASFEEFFDLWMGNKQQISIHGFIVDKFEKRVNLSRVVSKEQFVPHDESFYKAIVNSIKEWETKIQT